MNDSLQRHLQAIEKGEPFGLTGRTEGGLHRDIRLSGDGRSPVRNDEGSACEQNLRCAAGITRPVHWHEESEIENR